MPWMRVSTLAAGVLCLLVMSGCDHRSRPLRLVPFQQSGSIDMLPRVERGQVEPAVDDVPDLQALDRSHRRAVGEEYRALTPVEAQCLAAAESSLGNLLAGERSAVQPRGGLCHDNERAVAVMRRALSYAAAEARNRSAADALEAYYRLLETEGLRDLVGESAATLQEALNEVTRLRERGMTIPPEVAQLEGQQITLDERRVEAELAIVRLNSTLRDLTGLRAPDEQVLFWPTTELTVATRPIDIDLAVAEGLQMRPELNMLRYVERQLDTETLPVARQVLGGLSAIAGAQPALAKCCSLLALASLLCGSEADEAEVAARRRQLREYRRDRERAVEAEIRQAVYTVDARVKQVALAKRRLVEATLTASDAVERQQAGRGNFVEVTSAELAAVQARADLVSAVVAWKLAEVDLREAQGVLIFECSASGNPFAGRVVCP